MNALALGFRSTLHSRKRWWKGDSFQGGQQQERWCGVVVLVFVLVQLP